jgi:hypothetical protein
MTKPRAQRAERGYTNAERRAKLLRQCATFLASLVMQSDHAVRESGRVRGELAQAQYDFAGDLAETIDAELARDRRYDDNRNEVRDEKRTV